MSNSIPFEEQINDKNIEKLKKIIIISFAEILKNLNLFFDISVPNVKRKNIIMISKKALLACIEEITIDIKFISTRRFSVNVSTGKIAGIIAYRLNRWNIVQIGEKNYVEDINLLKINSFVGVLVATKYLNIEYSKINKLIRLEILYMLNRRYTNPESLGLLFDALLKQ